MSKKVYSEVIPEEGEYSPGQENMKNCSDQGRHPFEPGIATVVMAKVWARRARSHSLFDLHEHDRRANAERDFGVAYLAHADYPKKEERAKSLPDKTADKWQITLALVKDALRRIIEERLSTVKEYSAKDCGRLSREIAVELKEEIAKIKMPEKYKYVCTCYITKRENVLMHLESGCAWDQELTTHDGDDFVEHIYRNPQLFAVGTVYLVRCERKASPKATANEKPRARKVGLQISPKTSHNSK